MGDLVFRHTVPVGKRRCVTHRNYGYDAHGRPDKRTGFYEDDIPEYSDDDMAFGVQVRELRASLGMTLRDATTAAGLASVADMSGLEHGRARCNFDELKRRFLAWKREVSP